MIVYLECYVHTSPQDDHLIHFCTTTTTCAHYRDDGHTTTLIKRTMRL